MVGSMELINHAMIKEFSDRRTLREGSPAAGCLTSPVRCPSLPLPSIANFTDWAHSSSLLSRKFRLKLHRLEERPINYLTAKEPEQRVAHIPPMVAPGLKQRKGKIESSPWYWAKEGDPRFDSWDEEDSMVMSWLWNSMSEISDTFMFLPTAKEIWEAAQQTYSKVRDATRAFEIKSKIFDTYSWTPDKEIAQSQRPRSERLRSQVHITQFREDRSHGDVDSGGREENEFNKEDIGWLISLLGSLEKSKGTCSLAYSAKLHSSTKLLGGHARGVTALIVYLDNIIVTGNDPDEKKALRKYLAKEFKIKDLGKLKYFLGIDVAWSKDRIFVLQQKYVHDLLEETGKLGSRPSKTPIEPNHRLREFMEGAAAGKGMYQRLVGKLIHLLHMRLDIAYAMSVVSQFMQNPKDVHLHVVYQILQYLNGSPGKGILFRKGTTMELEA
ncbi:hypothetical protein RJ639_008806 [Escallonia herrerae]|uniref:Reverse transcriptase Ty1/copia-type domain-containing protein n=1 Tax=Escallonia herrerae TaxID=1293975 RepID=A0AA89ATP1_9ASTE|nr:hypothetical protein RJ639_008806 [Escallonia herrerae]